MPMFNGQGPRGFGPGRGLGPCGLGFGFGPAGAGRRGLGQRWFGRCWPFGFGPAEVDKKDLEAYQADLKAELESVEEALKEEK